MASDLFHNHEQISDEQIKERLKALLENNKKYSEKLQKLKDKGVSFNKFWSKKLYSEVLTIFGQFYLRDARKTCNSILELQVFLAILIYNY